MTDRKRLIELMQEASQSKSDYAGNIGLGQIADYLLEHGVIVLPCKEGDTLYAESAIKGHIKSFEVPDLAWVVEYREFFGKEIFLTREEAEQALKERADNV